jgi:hypothetical protein
MASWGSNRLDVFALGTDHSLYQNSWSGAQWSGFVDLGTEFTWAMDPIVISRETENYDLFLVERSSAAVNHKHYDGSSWTTTNLGGISRLPPAVTSREDAAIDIFIIDENLEVEHNSFFADTWSGFENLSTDSQGLHRFENLQPAAVSASADHIQVFTIASNSNLMTRRWTTTTGWGDWNRIASAGSVFITGPAAVSKNPNEIDVFALGFDSALYTASSTDGGVTWSSLTRLNGTFAYRPNVVSRGPGLMDVFLVGLNSELFTYRYDGGWDPLQAFSADSVLNAPSAVSWGPNRLDVFMVGGGEGVYHASSTGDGTWTPALSSQSTFLGGTDIGISSRVGASQ